MQTSIFNTPGLYGDHHVTAVRKQLLSLPGVSDVYASSAFQVVEVTYDEAQVSQETLLEKLEALGYLNEIPMVKEAGQAVQPEDVEGFFRQTATYATLKKTVSFQQRIPYSGRPLWNCPGLGVIKPMDN